MDDLKGSSKPTIESLLISRIHKAFTQAADDICGLGYLSQEERISLSHAIGEALGTFNETIDKDQPNLLSREVSGGHSDFMVANSSVNPEARHYPNCRGWYTDLKDAEHILSKGGKMNKVSHKFTKELVDSLLQRIGRRRKLNETGDQLLDPMIRQYNSLIDISETNGESLHDIDQKMRSYLASSKEGSLGIKAIKIEDKEQNELDKVLSGIDQPFDVPAVPSIPVPPAKKRVYDPTTKKYYDVDESATVAPVAQRSKSNSNALVGNRIFTATAADGEVRQIEVPPTNVLVRLVIERGPSLYPGTKKFMSEDIYAVLDDYFPNQPLDEATSNEGLQLASRTFQEVKSELEDRGFSVTARAKSTPKPEFIGVDGQLILKSSLASKAFEVGDRVRIISGDDDLLNLGAYGVVQEVYEDSATALVDVNWESLEYSFQDLERIGGY
jgi:hypothetical protein